MTFGLNHEMINNALTHVVWWKSGANHERLGLLENCSARCSIEILWLIILSFQIFVFHKETIKETINLWWKENILIAQQNTKAFAIKILLHCICPFNNSKIESADSYENI